MMTRRELLTVSGALAGQSAVARRADAAPTGRTAPEGYLPVLTPNGWTLPYERVGNTKVFHLVAEPVQHEFAEGLIATCWGYNGDTPGPTIEAVEGDHVRIYVTNHLPEPTTVHWHGMPVPNGMDGPGGLNQPTIPVGETFVYEFTLTRPGTFMYHSHFDEMVQINLGLMGMFVVHPRRITRPVERDYAILLMEWAIPAGAARPNPIEMVEFTVFTMNGKAFPATEPMVAELGDRVRIRLGNLSVMNHHPIHLHGMSFHITATDGGDIPESAQWPETTVLVPVGATRDITLVADNPGDWSMHCHMTHHFMNQMGHGFGNVIGADLAPLDARIQKLLPGYMSMATDGMGGMGEMLDRMMPVPENSIPMKGAKGPFGFIDMGGMVTLLKVRERLHGKNGWEIGWYDYPPGTVSRPAVGAELRRDGVDLHRIPRRPGSQVVAPPAPRAKDGGGHGGHGGHGG